MNTLTEQKLMLMLIVTLIIALIIVFILYYNLLQSSNTNNQIDELNGIWVSDNDICKEQGLSEIFLCISAIEKHINVHCLMYDDDDEIFDDTLCKSNSINIDKCVNIKCDTNSTYCDIFGDSMLMKLFYDGVLLLFANDKLFGKFRRIDVQ